MAITIWQRCHVLFLTRCLCHENDATKELKTLDVPSTRGLSLRFRSQGVERAEVRPRASQTRGTARPRYQRNPARRPRSRLLQCRANDKLVEAENEKRGHSLDRTIQVLAVKRCQCRIRAFFLSTTFIVAVQSDSKSSASLGCYETSAICVWADMIDRESEDV